jgi:hypothetical protein
MRVVALQRDCSKAQPDVDSGLLVSKCSTALKIVVASGESM